MGQQVSAAADYVYERLFGNLEASVVMLGLDAAGKTTLLYKLRIGEVVTTIPTIGFNVETVTYKSLSLVVHDIGGQDRLRPLWRRFYDNANAVIFVVDSCDAARLPVARDELHRLMAEDSLRDAKILVYANKQDAPGALPASEVLDRLQLRQAARGTQEWFVQGCSATKGQGLYEGLDWLACSLKRTGRKR